MNIRSSFWGWLRASGWAIALIALVQFALHLWANAHDNFFRDELYYMAAGQHLSPGYVEYPPFVALATAFSQATLGSSVVAIRLLPALAAVVIVFLTADMVAVMGGGPAAQALAAVAVAFAPIFIGSSGLMTMDPFDELWWALAAWVLIRMIKRQEPRMWLGFGVVAGVGLLTKLTIGFFVIALLLGLLLSGQRKLLFQRWLIFGGLIAVVIISPYLGWQAAHGFPVLEYTKAYSGGKTYQASPIEYFAQQMITINPLALPLWLLGLYFVFFRERGKQYRVFGWAYLFLYIFFMLQRAKFYWLSPAYPAIFAAAAYKLDLLTSTPRVSVPGSDSGDKPTKRVGWLMPTYISVLAITGLLLAPFAIPLLSPEGFIELSNALGGAGNAVKSENLRTSELPQAFADRYGWGEMVQQVKAAYDTLTPQEQAEACIFGANYGEAGAVDFYGPALGLPKAISGHNSYFLWGPQGCSGQVLITINVPLQDLSGGFESVEPAGHTSCTYCMPFENNAPIFIARGLKAPIEDVWPGVKDFN